VLILGDLLIMCDLVEFSRTIDKFMCNAVTYSGLNDGLSNTIE